MTPANDVFNLIHALDSNEKRYFKLLISIRSEESNYNDLFNAIAEQKNYDEADLRKKFKKQIKDFPNTKRNLYALVLRSLRLYQSRSSEEIRLFELLQNLEILFNKGLYSECHRMIKIAERENALAVNIPVTLLLLNWKLRIARSRVYQNVGKDYFKDDLGNKKNLLREYALIVESQKISNEFFFEHFQIGFTSAYISKKKLAFPINSYLTENKSLPAAAQVYIQFTLISYYRSITEYSKSYHHYKYFVRLIKSFPHLSSEYLNLLVSAHTNVLVTLYEMKKYTDCYAVIDELRKIKLKSNLAVTVFYSSYAFELMMLQREGEFNKAVHLSEEIEKGLKQYKNGLNAVQYVSLCCGIAYSYFGDGQYSEAIDWLKKILNEGKIHVRENMFVLANFLYILAHIGKGNYGSAVYLSIPFLRQMEQKKMLGYDMEKLFLNFIIKNLAKTSTVEERRKAFYEFKQQTEKFLLANPLNHPNLDYINFSSWLESKINGQNFAEIVKRKMTGKY